MSRGRPLGKIAVLFGIGVGLVACGGSAPESTGGTTGSTVVVTSVPTEPTEPTEPADGVPVGFGTIAARIVSDRAEPCDLCLWLADTDALRGRGLMEVSDLGGPDGMAFVYDRPRTTSFTMRNTLLPLTIVFYGADGGYLDAFDMEPCTAEPCASYPTPELFSVAIEVPRGSAAELGMVPGSELALLARDCETPSSH